MTWGCTRRGKTPAIASVPQATTPSIASDPAREKRSSLRTLGTFGIDRGSRNRQNRQPPDSFFPRRKGIETHETHTPPDSPTRCEFRRPPSAPRPRALLVKRGRIGYRRRLPIELECRGRRASARRMDR